MPHPPVNRSDIRYRLWFVPEAGIDQAPSVMLETVGLSQISHEADRELHMQYETTDWLDPEAGYTQFVEENKLTLSRFQSGEISTASFLVPYGTILIG